MSLTISGSTGIALPDGSVGAPSTRGQDANSGISYGADSIKFSTAGVERMAISNSGVSGGGKILQVKQTVLTGVISETVVANTYEDIAGYSCNITPATGSKVLVMYNANTSTTAAQYNVKIQLVRGSTLIAQGDQVGSNRKRATTGGWMSGDAYHIIGQNMTFLDTSPGGDGSTAITYKLQWTDSYSQELYLNRSDSDLDNSNYFTQISSMTLMEVGA